MSNKIVMSIYPTLLDSFYWVKKMNFREDKVQEILDKINRVPAKEFPEAALKGVQFEDCVNKLLQGVKLNMQGDEYVTENFRFKKDLVDKITARLVNHKSQQQYIQANVPTPIGLVKCYGFIDYTFDPYYIDLKTTSRYVFGKYRDNNQHKCYPLLAKLSGLGHKDSKYFVTDFTNTYVEPYAFTKQLEDEFIRDVVEFNGWCEENRAHIVHPKIWGL